MKDTIEIGLLVLIATLLVRQQLQQVVERRAKHKIVVDSCALIDGRIVDLAKAGFVSEQIVIPQFILRELQLLADGSDSHKRERARYGLDVAAQLQDEANLDVCIDRTTYGENIKTDDMLMLLAKKLRAKLYTTDLNLSKVATVEGVRIMNVNELAQYLRPAVLPGETLQVKIIQKGSNVGQGVGYAEDGTMVVVDGAAKMQGKQIAVTVARMHQTMAGKMIFASIQKAPVQKK